MTRAFNTIHDVVGNITMASTVLSVADGAMADIKKSLMKIRSLAVTTISKDLSLSERGYLEIVKNALLLDITRIADNTKLNDLILLDGTFTYKTFQVGFSESNQIWITFSQSMTSIGLGISAIALDCIGCSQNALEMVDEAINVVNQERAEIMGLQYRVENAKSNLENLVFNLCVDQCVVQGFDSLVRSQQDEEGAINYFV